MLLATICAFFSIGFDDEDFSKFFMAVMAGALVGCLLAIKTKMIHMPQLVAMLHSFVGFSATILGFSSHLRNEMTHSVTVTNKIETVIGVFIGSVTFTGSIIAFLKL